MKENNSWGKKFLTITSTMAIVASGAVAIATPAQAATHALYISHESDDNLAAKGGGFNLGTGGDVSVANAPAPNTGKARKIVKAADASPWGGLTILADGDTANSYIDNNNTEITLDFYNGNTGPVPVSLEATSPGKCKAGRTAEAATGWSTLTFDFSLNGGWDYCMGAGSNFTVLAIEPNFYATYENGNAGAYTGADALPNAGESYYVDNISIGNGTLADVMSTPPTPRVATSTVLTFESPETSGATPYDNFGGTTTNTVVAAPAGGNGGNVLKVHYDQGAAFYAGLFLANYASGTTRITDATHTTITMNVYSSSTASQIIRLKLEGAATTPYVDQTVRQGWNRLTFQFSGVTNWSSDLEFQKISIFVGFIDGSSDPKAAAADYYIDDVAFNGGTTRALPVAVTKATISRAAAVSGTAKKARVLTASATFAGSSSTKTYQWYRCTAAASATSTALPTSAAKCTIAKAYSSSATYTLATADIGKYMRVVAKATNSAGSTLSLSKTTAKVVR